MSVVAPFQSIQEFLTAPGLTRGKQFRISHSNADRLPMNPLDQALKDLLHSVSTESDLYKVASRFLDLSENKSFMDAGKPANNKELSRIVTIGLKSKLGLDPSGLKLLLQHHSRYDFFHGGGMLAGRIVQCFYFRRENRGCITVATLAGEVHYLRISVVASPIPEHPEQN